MAGRNWNGTSERIESGANKTERQSHPFQACPFLRTEAFKLAQLHTSASFFPLCRPSRQFIPGCTLRCTSIQDRGERYVGSTCWPPYPSEPWLQVRMSGDGGGGGVAQLKDEVILIVIALWGHHANQNCFFRARSRRSSSLVPSQVSSLGTLPICRRFINPVRRHHDMPTDPFASTVS